MNPEFRRNVWLELTARRIFTMTAVLLLIFFAAALSSDSAPASAAVTLYYFIVVFWGARNASLSVVGEIRDHTWDFQRLSSLGAAEMTWGKLFGSTIFNWFGGAICLAVIFAYRLTHSGLAASLINLVYFIVIGVIAQSVALLASLVAALRRQAHTRLEVFSYQAVGILAALAAYLVWSAADPAGSVLGRSTGSDVVPWWDHGFDAQVFLILSLAIFAGWTLVGCYRAMRLELKMRNGPYVWLAFLAFIGLYVAGFDAWLPNKWTLGESNAVALRLALAAWTYAVITYLMVFLEPKDAVLYRWLGAQISSARVGAAAVRLQAWMMSHLAALAVTAALLAWFVKTDSIAAAAFVVAAFGFFTRDVAIFVLLQSLPGPRRGDFAALVTLLALYVLIPSILRALALKDALLLFYPQMSDPVWLSPIIAWMQALAVAGIAASRVAAGGRRAEATA
ncbi:MAG TPA: hypothetical protein VN154_09370 [Rhizomicrobium sp.]|nr:hypothetical protein [Rhizomicrobium sp.]